MGSLSIWHWLIVLVIIVLVFGTKKLKNIGSDLGGAVKGFKDGVKDAQTDAKDASSAAQQVSSTGNAATTSTDKATIDVQAKEKA